MKRILFKQWLTDITEKDTMLHLSFRPSDADLLIIMDKAPNLRVLQLPKYCCNISEAMLMHLSNNNVDLVVSGNLDPRLFTPEGTFKTNVIRKIRSAKSRGLTPDEIYETIHNSFNVSESMLRLAISR